MPCILAKKTFEIYLRQAWHKSTSAQNLQTCRDPVMLSWDPDTLQLIFWCTIVSLLDVASMHRSKTMHAASSLPRNSRQRPRSEVYLNSSSRDSNANFPHSL